MDQRTEYLIQILDKIGAPLIAALGYAGREKDTKPEEAARQDAQNIAALLSRSVQMSIETGKVMDLNMADPEQSDQFRLSLMALCGPLVAGQFRKNGRVPEDPEQKQMIAAMESVLKFSENFQASKANIETLSKQEDDLSESTADKDMMIVQSLHVFTPIINALSVYPVGGNSPEKTLKEIAPKIIERARNLSETLPIDMSSPNSARYRMVLTKIMAELYAACHSEEGRKGAELNQDAIWKAYDIRTAMLESLVQNLIPGAETREPEGGGEEKAPESSETPPPEKESSKEHSSEEQPSAPSGNPMAMFAQKDSDGETQQPASKPEEKSEGTSQQNEKSSKPAEEDKSPADRNQGEDNEEDSGGDRKDGNNGNPMSFFKKSD